MLCAILKVRLWEFQNGKMGKNSSKIDQDTAKTVKRKILKNDSFCSFCSKVVFFLTRTVILQKGMYCRNFWDCFGSFFLFYIIKSGFFGVNGLPQVHRYGFYSVSAHFDPLRPPLGSLSDPRRHTLLSHGLCFKMHWKKNCSFFK